MLTSTFNIYGFRLRLSFSEAETTNLPSMREFDFFKCEEWTEPSSCEIKISLRPVFNNEVQGFTLFRTQMCEVRQINLKKRMMCYILNKKIQGIVVDQTIKDKRLIFVSASEINTLNEILFYIMMSVSGEFLDSSGLMRLHAASFTLHEKSFVFWGRQKAGKSTLANKMLNNSEAQIFSDEVTLFDIHNTSLKPFPINMSLVNTNTYSAANFFLQKRKCSIPNNRVAKECKLHGFFTLKPSTSNKFKKISFRSKLVFFKDIIFGIGLIQMAEYLLRFTNLPIQFKIFLNRLKLVRHLTSFNIIEVSRNSEIDQSIAFINKILSAGVLDNDNVS